MNKYEVFSDIHTRIINSVVMGSTPEGRLIIGIVAQRISDLLGLDGSQGRVLLPASEIQRNGRKYKKRKSVTHQQLAYQFFRDKEHYPWLDMLDIDPSWIDWMLKTKAGVKL